jgi:hypothetical protein
MIDSPQVRATTARAALGSEACKAADSASSTDLKAGDLGTQALTGVCRPLAETFEVGDRACLYCRDELQERERGEGRNREQGNAFDDSRNTVRISQQSGGERQH